MLVRHARLERKVRLAPKRAKPRRSSRARDTEFLTFVRDLPCCLCTGRYKVHAHHAGARPFGRKADDDTAIPMCDQHHRNWHDASGPFKTWDHVQRETWAYFHIGHTQRAFAAHQQGGRP